MTDFALHPDGELLVYVRDYDRVLRYASDGRFLKSIPAAGYKAGVGRIATTADGRVFLEHMGRVTEVTLDGTTVLEATTSDRNVSWRLAPNGTVTMGDPVGESPVEPTPNGGLLFASDAATARDMFQTGSLLAQRVGNAIVITDQDTGLQTRIETAWYLLPIRFPWPAAVPFLAAASLVALFKFLRVVRS